MGAAVVLLVAGGITWRIADDGGTYRPPRPSADELQIKPAGAATVLSELEGAIANGDADRARGVGGSATDELLVALVDNAQEARMDDVTLRYVDATTGVGADGVWSAAVAVTWRFAGFDTEASSAEVSFRFRAVEDAVEIDQVGDASLRTPIWMTGPLDVRRTEQVLILAPDGEAADVHLRLARRAVVTVRRVLSDWEPSLVVEVAPSGPALERALLAESGTYAQIAAVTGSGDGSIAEGSPIHVFVNPDVMRTLDVDGQQVVVSHEATHVATDAPRSRAPSWLVEGFADYVALRDTTLPISVTAAQISAQVRRKGVPDALPGPGDFDTLTTHLGAVYESAWLACVAISRRMGEEGLVRVYETASRGGDVDQVLASVGQWSEAGLVAAWQRLLATLA